MLPKPWLRHPAGLGEAVRSAQDSTPNPAAPGDSPLSEFLPFPPAPQQLLPPLQLTQGGIGGSWLDPLLLGDISALLSPTCIAEPLLQQGFELAHVLEAEVESLEAGDGGLAEIIAVELPHGQPNVALPGTPKCEHRETSPSCHSPTEITATVGTRLEKSFEIIRGSL